MLSLLDRLVVRPPDPARVGWLRDWTYAHRGLHSAGVPENSLAGFALAVERGLGVECDIQRSRDGQAMLVHDWELDRLTGVRGPLSAHSAEELAQIAFLDSEHKLARLDDLLALVQGKVPILIEVKSRRGYDVKRSCRAVARTLEQYAGPHAVMSFDPRVCIWFAKHSPQTVRGLVMREDEVGMTQKAWQRHLALWLARPEFIAYHVVALPNPMVASLRARGMPVLTWTVDSPERREQGAAHADALIAEGEGLA
ncbi:glycerophosphodiester phosphodiesterase family protein [Qipengyuania sp. NPDC077563]|uniref:glycerophosphodiester phosphodiesterase family protein n=1 Tax=Qipengyuania sp. NPDC077563 TaxID=3364497 RepID=UPI003850C0A5